MISWSLVYAHTRTQTHTHECYPTNFLGDNDSVVAQGVGSSGVAKRSSSGVRQRGSSVVKRSRVRVSHNRGGLSVGVGDGNGGSDVLDNGRNSGVGVALKI